MPFTIYNTLTRKKEEFVPREAGKVSMYTCGPTVYDYFHIGNARSFVTSDLVRRYLEYKGFDVSFVMNLTDIDDRIIARAIEREVPAQEVAGQYTDAFFEDIARLGIEPATAYPRATETVGGMIAHIQGLIDNGSAYVVEGDVYFRVAAFPAYGKLSGKRLEDLEAGARVEEDPRKENPADFALWKSAKPGEPTWDAPWGKGRPGWHIECSVMSRKYLGDSFDIHAGGNDLIFPHHENEIAQSEALYHKPFARYWMHFGFLNIDNEKMSKSLGNFHTTRDILDRIHPATLRFFYFQTHYRSPLNFSGEGLTAAEKGLHRLSHALAALREAAPGTGRFPVESYLARFEEAMDDDFNTPQALGVLFECVRDLNALLQGGDAPDAGSRAAAEEFLTRTAGGVFGILREEDTRADAGAIGRVMEVLLAARAKARAEKQWGLSDFIRDELAKIGVAVTDTKEGAKWEWKEPA